MTVKTTARCFENDRLVYYRQKADAEYWDKHWQEYVSPRHFQDPEKGELGELKDPFVKYLPKEGKILEAGCGLGTIVRTLEVLGYDCEGVEWGKETVDAVLELYPNLAIRSGDVTKMDVPDGYYKGYVSLGVVEHRKEGPDPFLQEAHRILHKDGVMLLSVPHFHKLRHWKAHKRFFHDDKNGLEFYQYAFKEEEFKTILEKHHFQVIDRHLYGIVKGVKDEIGFVRFLLRLPLIDRLTKFLILSSPWIRNNLGHMILFVCRKV